MVKKKKTKKGTRKTQHCGKCGARGHNKRSCKKKGK
jgi:hypothetical protein